MPTSIKNLTVIILALVAIAAWGLVIRQEIVLRNAPSAVPSPSRDLPRGRQPQPLLIPVEGTIPAGGSITLPAPGSGPTEETPVVEIRGAITDAETGRPVIADVQAGPARSGRGQVSLSQVSEFRLIFPATGETIELRITAPGYQEWAVELKPHVVRSKRLEITIELKRRPEPNEGPAGDQALLLGQPPSRSGRSPTAPAPAWRPII